MGQAPSGETYNAEGEGTPLIAGASDFGEFLPKPTRHTTAPAKLSRVGDIILCVRATIGDLNWSDREYCLGRGVAGIRPNREKFDPSFAWWSLHANAGNLAALGRGATFKQINRADIEDLEVSLPPLDEQRRIAAILDQADDLRRKRREALAALSNLAWAIFVEMFGEPRSNPKHWAFCKLDQLLEIPLRNGLSPSSKGTVERDVMTLSAITGSAFDRTCVKRGVFDHTPPADKHVSASDFYICRGNGNVQLVGKGFFAGTDLRSTVFPDTMIAARLSAAKVSPKFLEVMWNSELVRTQIESLARTTNGTFKVNQTVLESVTLLLPPLDLQRAFAARVAEIDKLKAHHRAHLARLDALFASLQHRAFRGDLSVSPFSRSREKVASP
jgi:type I restriction enzyme S subunit